MDSGFDKKIKKARNDVDHHVSVGGLDGLSLGNYLQNFKNRLS